MAVSKEVEEKWIWKENWCKIAKIKPSAGWERAERAWLDYQSSLKGPSATEENPIGSIKYEENFETFSQKPSAQEESSGPQTYLEPIKNPWTVRPRHYGKLTKPDLAQFLIQTGTPYAEGNIMKYIHRWKEKGGIEDLQKARHYIDMLIWENTINDNSPD